MKRIHWRLLLGLFVLLALQWACSGSKSGQQSTQISDKPTVKVEETTPPEEAVVSVSEPEIPEEIYQSKATKRWELLHMDLAVSFSWEQQYVFGEATLSLKPYFYNDSVIILDAKNFDIEKVTLVNTQRDLIYLYDTRKLIILLGQEFTRKDTLQVSIKYTAKPAERSNIAGSAAITSDQGLFFINPQGKIKGKPRQIWTQGETSYNSCWFPTIDAPNQRMTHRIKITIEEDFVTLSNGLLQSSVKLGNGLRTDHWVMDKPHAPYLVMMAIGEFAAVKDQWRNIDLTYYVEKPFKDYAKDIFAHTPEMLDFFSAKYGVVYPWQKYDQVIVRDYVSGAMENTTAVIFGDFVQRTKRQLMDDGNDKIVAHELAHHWFGNLVTCADWSQLTLNEGFANYAEYLWLEHKYGYQEAEMHRREELEGYLSSLQYGGTKNLIRYNYADEEEMFDAHSYNKGGLVLHSLRKYVGDEAFDAALKLYLATNAYSAVEVHQLRLAFEKTTGEDLSWFFNQWFLDKGHPTLEVNMMYDGIGSSIRLDFRQIQDPAAHRSLFILPVEVDVFYADGSKERIQYTMRERRGSLEIPVKERPLDVIVDPERTLLAEIEESWAVDEEMLLNRVINIDHPAVRIEGITGLMDIGSDLVDKVAPILLHDEFWLMRLLGVQILSPDLAQDTYKSLLKEMALTDGNKNVRFQALEKIAELEVENDPKFLETILQKGMNESGEVIAKALTTYKVMAPAQAESWKNKLIQDDDPAVITALVGWLAADGDTTQLTYIKEQYRKITSYDAISYMTNVYDLMLSVQDWDKAVELADHYANFILEEDAQPLQRFGVMQYIASVSAELTNMILEDSQVDIQKVTKQYERLIQHFERIAKAETNPQLKSAYDYIKP
jgi:aminopeptidase N